MSSNNTTYSASEEELNNEEEQQETINEEEPIVDDDDPTSWMPVQTKKRHGRKNEALSPTSPTSSALRLQTQRKMQIQQQQQLPQSQQSSSSSQQISEIPTNASYYTFQPHPLQRTYTFWFAKKEKPSTPTEAPAGNYYIEATKPIGDFSTVEGFWGFYSHLLRPRDLSPPCDYHLFRKGVKPIWEDEANSRGGKWMLRVKKEYSSRFWEDVLLAFIGEQFDVGDELNGVVLSIRDHDIISVWHKTSANQKAKERIRDTLRSLLRLPPGTTLEYQAFSEFLDKREALQPFKSAVETYVVPSAYHYSSLFPSKELASVQSPLSPTGEQPQQQ